MFLENIPKRKNRTMPSKRLGRGYGSGVGGHTVGRGQKGQKSRSGHKSVIFFEGGNRPFFSRVPKFPGFKSRNEHYEAVNIASLEREFKANDDVTLDALKEKGLVRKRINKVKILGYGELTKKLNIVGLPLSESAKAKLDKAGGTVK
jgi:large subunit ribosomal protein L15